MPSAKLLSRENISNQSLTTLVEKSQENKNGPFQEYELKLNSNHLELIPITGPKNHNTNSQFIKPISPDEGFESDIDTVSIISSDDSFASSTCMVEDHVLKHRENDSANGSSSDSEQEVIPKKKLSNEIYNFSDVLCYTDVKFPKVLVFCIKETVLVFNFENVDILHQFYTSFNTLKAVTNQRTYIKNLPSSIKFNLLHRTDHNGVTHIEISRESTAKPIQTEEVTVVNTPKPPASRLETKISQIPEVKKAETLRFFREKPKEKLKSFDDSRVILQGELKSRSEFFPSNGLLPFSLHSRKLEGSHDDGALRKVWKSAEDLLDAPKRPERKRKQKGRAPPPPVQEKNNTTNILKGQFVRVAVDPKRAPQEKSKVEEPIPNSTFQGFGSNLQTFSPNWSNIRQPLEKNNNRPFQKLGEYRKCDTLTKNGSNSWTNSVPRLLKKPRSRSETRNHTPMAYRYIDTTRPIQNSNSQMPFSSSNSSTISNRLFGLSQKLKEFSTNVVQPNSNARFYHTEASERRNSIGEMTYKFGNDLNLKSVIKKDDKRGRNEKKVTFSAYATVQVV